MPVKCTLYTVTVLLCEIRIVAVSGHASPPRFRYVEFTNFRVYGFEEWKYIGPITLSVCIMLFSL
jgi:hypothetical protein